MNVYANVRKFIKITYIELDTEQAESTKSAERKKKTTIPDKIFGTKWRNPIKLNIKEIVWYPFLRVFQLLLPKSNFLKGDWALGYVSIQI